MPNNFVFIFSLLCFVNIESCIGEKELPKLKGIVKTIIHSEHDVIDCVNIHQQPAFDHPLLKGHKIEMMLPQNIRPPQSNPSEELFFNQRWNEIEECPEGTVPIKRYEEIDEQLHRNASNAVANHLPHEYATMRVDEGKYYGTKFAATVWNPQVDPNDQLSSAQAWITAGPDDALNAIKIGWLVFPERYKDNKTRLFTMITANGYKTFCYDQHCSEYVQLSRKIFPGAPLSLISQYGSRNYDIWIEVFKARGNWYIQIDEEIVGYWPSNIFPLMKDSASNLEWGGEIVTTRSKKEGGHHTTTQMGSAHFANEKFLKSALIHNVGVKTREEEYPNDFERPTTLNPVVTNENCYSLLQASYEEIFGDHFFFGGPGYSQKCA